MEIINNLCSECLACKQSCAKKAITFIEDKEGFSYPHINSALCTDCGLCQKVCPMRNYESVKAPIGNVYAAQIKNKEKLARSSSGGMFLLLSEYTIKKGGVVYGAAWDEQMNVRHIGVNSMQDVNKITGSKYIHSDIGDSYIEIKEHLINGRFVYFTGTPCQVAGLILFLRKEYDNLLTSDLICHGTPSQKIFNLFKNQIEKEYQGTLISYNFREKKEQGWASYISTSIIKKGIKIQRLRYDQNMKAYYNAFIKGVITRMDCYQCPFAEPRRVGDITIADYWDIKKTHPDFPNTEEGVSLITVNTKKGKEAWDSTKEQCVWTKSTIDNVLKTCNTNFYRPTPCPKEREHTYQKAFTDFAAFRNSYHSKKEKNDFYKVIYKKKMRKYRLLSKLLDILGK